ncbi:MAG: SAM-dependent methyltransferase [Firmicutes bacterium HGW-Firmicutes-14]|nr:MAG: SAM-dependent methyltransferase [Firmicutes bacterium HGW-Firmicutes-14]
MESIFERDASVTGFFLKDGYKSREKPDYFIDETGSIDWQPRVYTLAGYLGERCDCSYIIDIGCGRARKLINMYPDYQVVGIDFGENIRYCEESYPHGSWIEFDFEQPQLLEVADDIVKNAIIVCADVVEHLVNPSHLFCNLRKMMDLAPVCLLSTPERDLVRGPGNLGPPGNTSHVREWNIEEFTKLLRFYDFNLGYIGLTASNNQGWQMETILAVIGSNKNDNMNSCRCDLDELKPEILKRI